MRTASEQISLAEAPDFFGPQVLGKILGLNEASAYQLAKQKDFPAKRIGRKIIISKSAFLRWWESS